MSARVLHASCSTICWMPATPFAGDLGEDVATRGWPFQPGLTAKVLDRDGNGRLVRKAGVMAVVRRGGTVRPGDAIVVQLPQPPHHALDPV